MHEWGEGKRKMKICQCELYFVEQFRRDKKFILTSFKKKKSICKSLYYWERKSSTVG